MTDAIEIPSGGPQLLRAMNEQALLESIRQHGPISRGDLARRSRLSKPTVSLALTNLDRAGLIQESGKRTGQRGPAAALYEIRHDAGYVLAIDVGRRFVRTAVANLSGRVLARDSSPVLARQGLDRVREMVSAADALLAQVGLTRARITQTVVGSPGVFDPKQDAIMMTGDHPGWDRPEVLAAMREAFGDIIIENDVDAAALAEHDHGHGREFADFAFVTVGTGVGVGLMLGGRLRRGAHGAAGEIGFLPFIEGGEAPTSEAFRHGAFETIASAAGVVRAAHEAGMTSVTTAESVFAAAASGDENAERVVRAEAEHIAKALAAVITVVDPDLIVLGGGIGRAAGFVDAVKVVLAQIAPVMPEVRVSALGEDAVVDGCLATGARAAWDRAIQLHLAAVPGSAEPAVAL